jgi:hypothetical protein
MPGRLLAFVTSAVLAVVAQVAGSHPALAAPSGTGETAVSFVVGPAPLTITVGDGQPVQLGRADVGGTIIGQLGNVTVTGDGPWVATVVATDFITADEKPQTIPAKAISYWSGPLVEGTGKGDLRPGQETADSAQPLDPREFRTAFVFEGAGPGVGTWNPTLEVTVPGESLPGTYSGTVTHSVA